MANSCQPRVIEEVLQEIQEFRRALLFFLSSRGDSPPQNIRGFRHAPDSDRVHQLSLVKLRLPRKIKVKRNRIPKCAESYPTFLEVCHRTGRSKAIAIEVLMRPLYTTQAAQIGRELLDRLD